MAAFVVLVAIAVGAAQGLGPRREPPRPPMVAGELVIRLRPDFPACAHCLVAKGQGFAGATGSRILDQVRLRHGITRMEPVFGGPHVAEQRRAAQLRFGAKASGGGGLGARGLGAQLSTVDLSQIYLVRVDPRTDLLALAGEFRRDPNVVSAEPNYVYKVQSIVDSRRSIASDCPLPVGALRARRSPEDDENKVPSPTRLCSVGEDEGEGAPGAEAEELPNDPFLNSSGSWGQNFPDLWGLFQIHAPEAWELSEGEGVVVAVIDTGIDIEHPDLAANVWHNTGEIPGNGIDDDGNGFVDDVDGWDFTHCKKAYADGQCIEAKEPSPDVTDRNGHGTHVAGTIAAVGDNGIGIIGVAPQAQVMAVKGVNDQGQGTNADLAEALVYAAENGAKVINASWSGPPSDTIKTAIDYVTQVFDAVVVAAAGNDAAPLERGYYPTNLPNVIAVGATTHTDEQASFSNFGGPLDLVAPGGGDTEPAAGIDPQRSILSLFSATATGLDSLGTECHIRCVRCEDGSAPQEEGEPCLPNYCVERTEVCEEGYCYPKCVRCRDGTVLPPDREVCPFYDNTCAESREMCVPGLWVLGEDYLRAAGTSFAAPHVSGVAALVRSRHPEFTREQVRQVLLQSADDLGPAGWDLNSGYGRVNAQRAVAIDDMPVAEILVPENRGKIWERNFPFTVTGTVAAPGGTMQGWRLTLRREDGGTAIEIASGTAPVSHGPLGTLALASAQGLELGQRYVLQLEVEGGNGDAATDTKVFLIPNPQFAAIPVPDPFDEGGGDGSLSADGKRLVVARADRDSSDWSLWVFDSTTSALKRFRDSAQGRLSPDGQFLLYADTTNFVYWRYVLEDIDSGESCTVPIRGLWAASPAPVVLGTHAERAAFLSGESLDPTADNSDGSLEAFLFELPSGPARQVTDGPHYGSEIQDDLVMSPDGKRLGFSAQTNFDPTASTGSVGQVFVYDDETKKLRQVSRRSPDGPQWGQRPSLNADGSKVAFAGDGIYLADVKSGAIDQILDATGLPDVPLLSADGSKLAFVAALDLDPSVMNEDLSPEIFLMDLATNGITQVTDSIDFPYVRYGTLMDAAGSTFLTALGGLNGLALHPGVGRIIRRRSGNHPPVLDAPTTIVVAEGSTAEASLCAHDPDGDHITFHVERSPFDAPYLGQLTRSVLDDHGDGTAVLQLAPCYGTAGHYQLRIAAFDRAGEVAVQDAALEIEALRPDINEDGQVDDRDLTALVKGLFGGHPYTTIRCGPSDLNNDGVLSAADITAWVGR